MLNLVKLQERLKDVPMQALMQYANGMNPQVPPFLALGELNRRKQMQEAAAAEQAKQMQGAPTVKEQIEQQAGLMALQGARQQSAMQQLAAQQAAAPMPAPNTTETQPVQMARGGIARNPEAMKKLMMLAAMRRGGIDRLPMRSDMFKREAFAGGGIVAFAGNTDGSFVETSPGFYEQKPEEELDESKLNPFQRLIYRQMKKDKELPDVMERRRAFGAATEAPDTTARARADLERREKEMAESDTFVNRLMALQPGKFGSGKLGASVAQYEKARKADMDEIRRLRAIAEDQKEAAAIAFKEGRFADYEKDREAARKATIDAAEKMSAIARDEAQIKQAEAGAKSAGRIPVMEQVYADLKSGDPRRVASAMAYLGQAKTGVITDEDAVNAWNKLGFVEKNKLAKLDPPVTNAMEYKAYLMQQRAAIEGGGTAIPKNRVVDFSQLPK